MKNPLTGQVAESTMKAGQYLGLFKFFRERTHLEQFLDGCLYCNTPEYYRRTAEKGIGDREESCLLSVRAARGDNPFDVEVDGQPAGQASDFLLRMGRKDGWLHCWAGLILPGDAREFEKLKNDFRRIQEDFGSYYAYVSPEHSHQLQRIQSIELGEC